MWFSPALSRTDSPEKTSLAQTKIPSTKTAPDSRYHQCGATRRSEITRDVSLDALIIGRIVHDDRRLHGVPLAGRRAVRRVVVHEDRVGAEGAAEAAEDELLIVEPNGGEPRSRRQRARRGDPQGPAPAEVAADWS